jgi:hypothetical protein
MRKILATWALGGAMLAALSVAATACDYYQKTNAAAEQSQQTAQAQPPSDSSHN